MSDDRELYRKCARFMLSLDDPRTAADFTVMGHLSPQPGDTVAMVRDSAWRAIRAIEAGDDANLDQDDWEAIDVEEKIHRFARNTSKKAARQAERILQVAATVAVITAFAVLTGNLELVARLVMVIGGAGAALGGVQWWRSSRQVNREVVLFERAASANRSKPSKFYR